MTVVPPPPTTEFYYDALHKVAVARAVTPDGEAWILQFRQRHDDDSMSVIVREPTGTERTLTLTDADFTFDDGAVTLRPLPAVVLRMEPLYLKKLRGFTRGNIPTPDIPGPSLP